MSYEPYCIDLVRLHKPVIIVGPFVTKYLADKYVTDHNLKSMAVVRRIYNQFDNDMSDEFLH